MHYSELILLVLLQVCIYFVLEKKFSRFILKIKLVDKPGKNKIHSKTAPLTGGPLIFLSIVTYFIFNYLNILDKSILNESLIIFVIGITFAFFVGIIDDILHINPQKKRKRPKTRAWGGSREGARPPGGCRSALDPGSFIKKTTRQNRRVGNQRKRNTPEKKQEPMPK